MIGNHNLLKFLPVEKDHACMTKVELLFAYHHIVRDVNGGDLHCLFLKGPYEFTSLFFLLSLFWYFLHLGFFFSLVLLFWFSWSLGTNFFLCRNWCFLICLLLSSKYIIESCLPFLCNAGVFVEDKSFTYLYQEGEFVMLMEWVILIHFMSCYVLCILKIGS